jgi:hypothetical protein
LKADRKVVERQKKVKMMVVAEFENSVSEKESHLQMLEKVDGKFETVIQKQNHFF